jgi:hypothetical protein
MPEEDALFAELKQLIISPLFEFGEQQVRKRGGFYPFGATLRRNGEVAMEATYLSEDKPSHSDVLSMLHAGLRDSVEKGDVSAVGVCEWVKITPEGGKQTDAMKVLVEHERGLIVAFYVPCQRRVFRGWSFEDVFAKSAEGEVRPWDPQRVI